MKTRHTRARNQVAPDASAPDSKSAVIKLRNSRVPVNVPVDVPVKKHPLPAAPAAPDSTVNVSTDVSVEKHPLPAAPAAPDSTVNVSTDVPVEKHPLPAAPDFGDDDEVNMFDAPDSNNVDARVDFGDEDEDPAKEDPADPAANGSDPADPAANGSDPADPAANGSDPADPAANGSDPADPAANGSDPADPAANGSDSADPANGSGPADPMDVDNAKTLEVNRVRDDVITPDTIKSLAPAVSPPAKSASDELLSGILSDVLFQAVAEVKIEDDLEFDALVTMLPDAVRAEAAAKREMVAYILHVRKGELPDSLVHPFTDEQIRTFATIRGSLEKYLRQFKPDIDADEVRRMQVYVDSMRKNADVSDRLDAAQRVIIQLKMELGASAEEVNSAINDMNANWVANEKKVEKSADIISRMEAKLNGLVPYSEEEDGAEYAPELYIKYANRENSRASMVEFAGAEAVAEFDKAMQELPQKIKDTVVEQWQAMLADAKRQQIAHQNALALRGMVSPPRVPEEPVAPVTAAVGPGPSKKRKAKKPKDDLPKEKDQTKLAEVQYKKVQGGKLTSEEIAEYHVACGKSWTKEKADENFAEFVKDELPKQLKIANKLPDGQVRACYLNFANEADSETWTMQPASQGPACFGVSNAKCSVSVPDNYAKLLKKSNKKLPNRNFRTNMAVKCIEAYPDGTNGHPDVPLMHHKISCNPDGGEDEIRRVNKAYSEQIEKEGGGHAMLAEVFPGNKLIVYYPVAMGKPGNASRFAGTRVVAVLNRTRFAKTTMRDMFKDEAVVKKYCLEPRVVMKGYLTELKNAFGWTTETLAEAKKAYEDAKVYSAKDGKVMSLLSALCEAIKTGRKVDDFASVDAVLRPDQFESFCALNDIHADADDAADAAIDDAGTEDEDNEDEDESPDDDEASGSGVERPAKKVKV